MSVFIEFLNTIFPVSRIYFSPRRPSTLAPLVPLYSCGSEYNTYAPHTREPGESRPLELEILKSNRLVFCYIRAEAATAILVDNTFLSNPNSTRVPENSPFSIRLT